jgi:hypothetical protein
VRSWKAGSVQAVAGSNPASSAALTRGNAAPPRGIQDLPTGRSLSLGLSCRSSGRGLENLGERRRTLVNALSPELSRRTLRKRAPFRPATSLNDRHRPHAEFADRDPTGVWMGVANGATPLIASRRRMSERSVRAASRKLLEDPSAEVPFGRAIGCRGVPEPCRPRTRTRAKPSSGPAGMHTTAEGVVRDR